MPQRRAPGQEIDIDTGRKLVQVRISGFFSPEAAHAATWETRRAIEALGAGCGQHVTLYDLTEAAPAPPETVELIRLGFANPIYRRIWARRVAFCTPSVLLRRQVERIRQARPDIGIFATRAEALDFLLAP